MKSIHRFVKKVQNSDETTKKLWVLVCSAISMMLVVSLWMAYSNITIARIPGPTSNKQLTTTQKQLTDNQNGIEKPGFFAIFTAGTKIIFDALKARLSVKHDIVIQKQEVNFMAEDIEPVKGAKLP